MFNDLGITSISGFSQPSGLGAASDPWSIMASSETNSSYFSDDESSASLLSDIASAGSVNLSSRIKQLINQLELNNDQYLLRNDRTKTPEEAQEDVNQTIDQIRNTAETALLSQANLVPETVLGLL